MSFQDELEKILDEQFKRLDGTEMLPIYNRPTAVHQALTSIINLVEKSVIGEDEYSIDPLWAGQQGYWAKNELRQKQRAIIRGNSETL